MDQHLRWQNQEEALQFALEHTSCMLDMEMGTGKTRVAIDVVFERQDVRKVLVVCPKAVISVWRQNLQKFHSDDTWDCWDNIKETIKEKATLIEKWLSEHQHTPKQFVIVNYDIVWRQELGEFIHKKANFDMVILDESHRAKTAGSKVSKYLALLGRHIKYKMCLSGTPMANSPLDVYGQYRFLDPKIFGTNHHSFLQNYAITGGPESRFIIGFKNQKELQEKFQSIAYTCKMTDIADRIKLPDALPPIKRMVQLPTKDMRTLKKLSKEFVAECGSGHVVVSNVLVKMLRMQQIASGFCQIEDVLMGANRVEELNTAKEDELYDLLSDVSPLASVVVFCVFRHDIRIIRNIAEKVKRKAFEVSGEENTISEWKQTPGAVLAVQIQAGAEGIDMTNANYAIYFSLPHSLALYNQSKARLYRPGQTRPVSFIHLIAEDTIDDMIYNSLERKEDIITAIKNGSIDFEILKNSQ